MNKNIYCIWRIGQTAR